jgi:hypothetical protein
MEKKLPKTAWEKGKSGNPHGRPKKGTALSDVLRERADAAKLADALLKIAYTGDVAAIKAVYDRLEGRAKEAIDLNMSGELDAKLTAILGGRK